MKPGRHLYPLLVSLGIVLALAAPARAQKITGEITGTVTDSTGAALPGAAVTAVCSGTGLTRSVVASTAGGFSLPELPVCVYKVSATMQGFKTTSREVQVAVSNVTKADFKLQIGEKAEEITVEGVAPLVEFSDKLNNYVDKERIDNMPLSGRDFNSLLGVDSRRAARPRRRVPGRQHQRRPPDTSNNYMIDGISNNDRYYGDSLLNQTGVVGVPASLVPMDAIAEFTVQQTPSAEFGVKGGAAINVVMKSGTNEFHGSGEYFLHDDFADAANFFSKSSGPEGCTGSACGNKTPLSNKQFGGTFGGPIVKDKTFFFVYYEGQRLSTQSPYTAFVPTPGQVAEARARIADAGMQTNVAGENLLKYYPKDPSGQVAVSIPAVADSDSMSVKLDHKLSQATQISARYFYSSAFQSASAFTGTLSPPADVGPPDLFNSVLDPKTKAQLGALNWTSTFGNNKVFEARFGYTRFENTITPNNKIDPKSLGFDTGPLDPRGLRCSRRSTTCHTSATSAASAATRSAPPPPRPTTWPARPDLDQGEAQHQVRRKLAASHRGQPPQPRPDRARRDRRAPAIPWTPWSRCCSAGSTTPSRSFGTTVRKLQQNSFGAFVNDDIRLSPRFTVNVGLRYDYSGALGEANNLGSNFFPDRGLVDLGAGIDQLYNTDKNNFGPRLGFAWDVRGNGKTALRAGYALTYDVGHFGDIAAPRTTFSGAGPAPGRSHQVEPGRLLREPGRRPRRRARRPVGDLRRSRRPGGRQLRLRHPGRAHLRAESPGVASLQRVRGGREPQDPDLPFLPRDLPARGLPEQRAHALLRRPARDQPVHGPRPQRAAHRDADSDQVQASRPFASRFPDYKHIVQLVNDGKTWYDSLQVTWRQQNWKGIDTQYNFTLGNCQDYVSVEADQPHELPPDEQPLRPGQQQGSLRPRHPLQLQRGRHLRHPGDGQGLGGYGLAVRDHLHRALRPPLHAGALQPRPLRARTSARIRANCSATPIQYNYRRPQLHHQRRRGLLRSARGHGRHLRPEQHPRGRVSPSGIFRSSR